MPFLVLEHIEPQFQRDVHFRLDVLAFPVDLRFEHVEVVGAVEVTVADNVLAAEREVALRQRIGREMLAVRAEVAQVEVRQPERDVLVVDVVQRPLPAQFRRARFLHAGIHRELVVFRRVEIAAVHADLRDGVFERAVQRQVAHRHAAPGYLQVGDPERRCDVPGGVRSRCPILCRVVRCTAFGYSPGCLCSCRAARGFHQRREIVAFGRHFEQRRDPGGIDSVETKTHRPHVALGELHAQRIHAHHGRCWRSRRAKPASEAVPSVRSDSRCSVLPRSRMSAESRPSTAATSSACRK